MRRLNLDGSGADIVLLDVMLPGMKRYRGVQTTAGRGAVPVTMVTARDSEIDKVVGLELGAGRLHHQALFHPGVDRQNRAVRLRRGTDAEDAVRRSCRPARCGWTSTGSVHGTATSLPLKEFDLLEYLIRNAGRVLTKAS